MTLLEAVVALAILSAGLTAVFSWYGTLLVGLKRAEERLEVVQFSKNFESYLSTLNLSNEVDNVYVANGLSANWSAKLVEGKKEGKTLAGGLGHYRFGLYTVTAEIYRIGEDAQIGTLSTRIVGYEGLRLPSIVVGNNAE